MPAVTLRRFEKLALDEWSTGAGRGSRRKHSQDGCSLLRGQCFSSCSVNGKKTRKESLSCKSLWRRRLRSIGAQGLRFRRSVSDGNAGDRRKQQFRCEQMPPYQLVDVHFDGCFDYLSALVRH